MSRISELHYSNAYAASSGVSEFLEVALLPQDDPEDFTVSFYHADGRVGLEIQLDHPDVRSNLDPETGEMIYVISADDFDILLTDPDGRGSNNYEAYALVNTDTDEVEDFYDIGGGTRNIVALDGLAAGAVSENIPVLVGPNSTTTTLQFNQPDPDELSYDAIGAGDTGVACFTAGTLVKTPTGARPVERLRAGDRVITASGAVEVLRWAGQTTVRACAEFAPEFAPVRIAKGYFGAEEDICVSPQHRVLVRGWQAELYFGCDEMLVAAKDLLGHDGVSRAPCDLVTYVHLLFDQHELLNTQGLVSESFLPGDEGLKAWDTSDEIYALFPQLRSDPLAYGQTARPVMPARVAAVLRA